MLDEAKALGLNVSRAAEAGLAAEQTKARTAAWKRENSEAIAAYNDYIDKHGVPLADLRKF